MLMFSRLRGYRVDYFDSLLLEQADTFIQEILLCVAVPVVVCAALRASPRPVFQFKVCVLITTTMTQLRGWEETVNLDEISAFGFNLVLHEGKEL